MLIRIRPRRIGKLTCHHPRDRVPANRYPGAAQKRKRKPGIHQRRQSAVVGAKLGYGTEPRNRRKSHRLPHRRQMLPRRPEVIQIQENAPSFADRKTGTPTSRHAALSATLPVCCLPARRHTGGNTDRQTGEPARRQWYTQADGHGDSPACARAGIPAAKRTRQCGRRDACRENKLKYNVQKDKEA